MTKQGVSKGRLMVVCKEGKKQRFLRGVLTHGLVQRGVDFETAYATARAVRDRLDDRSEVPAAEIDDLVDEHFESTLGYDPRSTPTATPPPNLFVRYEGVRQPFSRGLLARSVYAAGIGLDRAYLLVARLEGQIRGEEIEEISSSEIALRMGDLIEEEVGAEVARRYRVIRHLRRLPRPLVVYVGGASGTGKSTLGLELAPLLRIHRLNSTDTVRQVMRMVFSPAILPAIHGSSFEPTPEYENRAADGEAGEGSDDESLLVQYFEEQTVRVLAGVRAVVERSIVENMSVLVEGVHIVPPHLPFGDLEGAAYQVPLLLSTMDAEIHRTRFLARGSVGARRAERYLQNFEAIRSIHDFLLQRAEQYDVPLVDTSTGEPPVAASLGLVAAVLQRRLPALDAILGHPRSPPKALLLIIDGFADRPVRALGGRTPLQAADLPTMDRLATEGQSGLADPVAPGVVPDTAAGSLALFGQSPSAMRRGPVEALGTGLELSPADVVLRGNLATLDENGLVIDRRAGRIRDEAAELARSLDRLDVPGLPEGVEVRVRAGTEHRLAIVIRGDGLSANIRGSDPGETTGGEPPLTPRPEDPNDEPAAETARILALFEQRARRRLQKHPANRARRKKGLPVANAVLTRGAGRVHRLVPLEEAGVPLRLAFVGGDRTVLGLAQWIGAETVVTEAMTANLDTDLDAKFEAAGTALEKSDVVVVHVKGADIAAHDQRPDLKVEFLERVDAALGRLLARRKQPLRVAIAGDHATLSESGQHAADPLPVLLWGEGIAADPVTSFDETAAAAGAMGRFPLQMLLGRLVERTPADVEP